METPSWIGEFPGAVTVCDAAGIILEMNDRAALMFAPEGGRDLIGASVFDCHPQPARAMLERLMAERRPNTYTTERNGRWKLVHQSPWYRDGEYAGFVEIIVEIPGAPPHFVRT